MDDDRGKKCFRCYSFFMNEAFHFAAAARVDPMDRCLGDTGPNRAGPDPARLRCDGAMSASWKNGGRRPGVGGNRLHAGGAQGNAACRQSIERMKKVR
ncbi:hypothetical protein [Burkholderia gladioli]|uniref:hypothetical protein n=1 Tax=Burkholderia gladioli TaxID=28095 RepID=UPI00163E1ECA|nr:hypothetical protein [Burkholderia gladioli]URV27685.1 hypothetical protein NAL90_31725 [Burkholderia gladioli]